VIEVGHVKWFDEEAESEEAAERRLADILVVPDTEFSLDHESWKMLESGVTSDFTSQFDVLWLEINESFEKWDLRKERLRGDGIRLTKSQPFG
jgi:hypothetical protein